MEGRCLGKALFRLRVLARLAESGGLSKSPAPKYFRGDVGGRVKFQKL